MLQSRGRVVIFSCHWSVSVISFNEKSKDTTINFVSRTKRNYSVTICIYNVLVYYCDEKIRYKWNLIFFRQCYQGFRFITLIASTNCRRRKRKFLVWDNLSRVYEVLGVLWLYDCIKYKDFGDWIIKTEAMICDLYMSLLVVKTKSKKDVYVAGLWFLVLFGGDCDSYIIYIGLFQCNGG